MRLIRAGLVLALLMVMPPCRADWINLTGSETAPNIAEIYVMDDHVRLVLEVYIGDLDKFTELMPNEWFTEPDANRPSLEARMRIFASERFKRIRRITAAFLYQGSLPVAGFAGIIGLPGHLTVALAGFELNLPPSAQFHPLQLSSDSKPPGSPSLGCGM